MLIKVHRKKGIIAKYQYFWHCKPLMFKYFILSQEVNLWHLVPLLVKCHRCAFIDIVSGFKHTSSNPNLEWKLSSFFSLPNLIWVFLTCLSQRDRSRLHPLPCQHTCSWEQTQLKHAQSWAQSDRASCGPSPCSLWKDKLAITSADTLHRRPAEIMTGFLLHSAEMEDLTFSDKRFISVLVTRCPVPWGGTLNSCGQFAVLCVCLSPWESHGGSRWDRL